MTEVAGYEVLVTERKARKIDVGQIKIKVVILGLQELGSLGDHGVLVRTVEEAKVSLEYSRSGALGLSAGHKGKHAPD
jgi:hypothetical protein